MPSTARRHRRTPPDPEFDEETPQGLDVQITFDGRDEKAAELAAAEGTVVRHVDESGLSWVVMADPEGNEFCVT